MPHALLLTLGEAPQFGIGEAYLAEFEDQNPGVIAKKLQAVTDEMLGYIAPAVTLPLISWGSDMRQKVADLLVYELRSFVGLNADPAAVSDQNVILRAEAARRWGMEVGLEKIQPADLVDSSADGLVGASTFTVDSDEPRGW